MLYGVQVYTQIQFIGPMLDQLQFDSDTILTSGGIDKVLGANSLGVWSEWLGSINGKKIQASSCFTVLSEMKVNPNSNDIKNKLSRCKVAIFLATPLRFESGSSFRFIGKINPQGNYETADEMTDLNYGRPSGYWNWSSTLFQELINNVRNRNLKNDVKAIYDSLVANNDLKNFPQLFKSKNDFIQAYNSIYYDQRIPMLVQSLESLVCLDRRENYTHFGVKASKYLNVSNIPAPILSHFSRGPQEALELAYHLRSKLMHGYTFDEIQKPNAGGSISKDEVKAVEFILEETARQYFYTFLCDPNKITYTTSRQDLHDAWVSGNV